MAQGVDRTIFPLISLAGGVYIAYQLMNTGGLPGLSNKIPPVAQLPNLSTEPNAESSTGVGYIRKPWSLNLAYWKWQALYYTPAAPAKQSHALHGEVHRLVLLQLACAHIGATSFRHKGMFNAARIFDRHGKGYNVDIAEDEIGADIIHTLAGWGYCFDFVSMRDGHHYTVQNGAYSKGGYVKGHKDDHWDLYVPFAGDAILKRGVYKWELS